MASGAAVAVLGAAGWASGLFSYDTPSRNTAAPDDVRAGLPDASATATSAEPSSEPARLPRRVRVRLGLPVRERERVRTAVALDVQFRAERVGERRAFGDPSAEAESSALGRGPGAGGAGRHRPVLRRGDRGPEVVELQQRLRQVWLYQGT